MKVDDDKRARYQHFLETNVQGYQHNFPNFVLVFIAYGDVEHIFVEREWKVIRLLMEERQIPKDAFYQEVTLNSTAIALALRLTRI